LKKNEFLTENQSINIVVDISDYITYLKKHVSELYDDLARRTNIPTSSSDIDEASELITTLIDETQKNAKIVYEKIKNQIPKIEIRWTGTSIFIKPWFEKNWNFSISHGVDDFNISVGDYKSKRPDFTIFSLGQRIDDVLDVGDTDNFNNPSEENDYFVLVDALSSQSVWNDPERGLILFTARPKKDRSIYDDTQTLPKGIWLTTSPDEAEGYAREFGDRDLYKIKIKQKWLMVHPSNSRYLNYQTTQNSPVEWIERLTENINEAWAPPPALSPLSGHIRYEKQVPSTDIKCYYRTNDDEIIKNIDNEFPMKKGPFGEGIYWSGTAYNGFDPLDVYYIEISIDFEKPLILKGGTKKEEAVIQYEQINKDGYDGVIWIDDLGKIRGGVCYNPNNVKYLKNPHIQEI
jgi:hypothetical protein